MMRLFWKKPKPSELDGLSFKYAGIGFTFPYPGRADHIFRRMIAAKGFYELELLEALRALVPAGQGVALDCGANIGNHSVYFSKVMGLHTLAFEPVPDNIHILRQMVAANHAEAMVDIVTQALGAELGQVTLSTPQVENPGMFRVSGDQSGVLAECTTLDLYLKGQAIDAARIQVIKIDVEGYECEVLRGGLATIARADAVMVAEFAEQRMFEKFNALASAHGYVPRSVYCHTPTVVFAKTGLRDATEEVHARIAATERKLRGEA